MFEAKACGHTTEIEQVPTGRDSMGLVKRAGSDVERMKKGRKRRKDSTVESTLV